MFKCSLLIWVLLLFSCTFYVLGSDNTCSICSGSNCSNENVQAYITKDITPQIEGCTVEGLLDTQSKTYIDHLIYVENDKKSEIYLTLTENYTSTFRIGTNASLKIEYRIALYSLHPVTWIISYDSNDDDDYVEYSFYATRKSKAITPNGKEIRFTAHVDAIQPGSSWRQVKFKACHVAFYDNCDDASYLKLPAVSSVQLNLGPSSIAGTRKATDKCSLQPGRARASLEEPVHAAESCFSPAVESGSLRLFVIDINSSIHLRSNASIRLELDGLSDFKSDVQVQIILNSTNPIHWQPVDKAGRDISATLTFELLSGTLDKSELAVSNDAGSVHIQETPRLADPGKTLLSTVRSIYKVPILAYSKFSVVPNFISLKVDNYQEIGFPVGELIEKEAKLHCSSVDAYIEMNLLPKYDFNLSQVVFGNGSCTLEQSGNKLFVRNLSKCGLVIAGFDTYQMKVTTKNQSHTLTCHIDLTNPLRFSLNVFTDHDKQKEAVFPLAVSENKNIFYAEFMFTVESLQEIDFSFQRCFLSSHDNTTEVVLIEENCPADHSVSFIIRHAQSPTQKFFRFSFPKDIIAETVPKQFNLTCVFYRCLISANTYQSVSVLPKCLHENGLGCGLRQPGNQLHAPRYVTEQRTVGPFVLKQPETTTAVDNSDSMPAGIIIGVVIVSVLVGVGLAALFCEIRLRHEACTKRSHTNCILEDGTSPLCNGDAQRTRLLPEDNSDRINGGSRRENRTDPTALLQGHQTYHFQSVKGGIRDILLSDGDDNRNGSPAASSSSATSDSGLEEQANDCSPVSSTSVLEFHPMSPMGIEMKEDTV